MADPIEKSNNEQDPSPDNPQKTTEPPAKENADNGAQDTLPEKFKGKSAEDIAKSYLELEKNIGQKSNDLQKREQELIQYKQLVGAIAGDPELKSAVEKKLLAKKEEEKKQAPDDTRIAVENGIVATFEERFGLNRLDQEKRKELNGKIGQELLDMLDPGGSKSLGQIMSELPLNRLSGYLEKAYKLATTNDREERARSEAFIQARQNDQATIGSMPSGSINPDSMQLTDAEKKAADRFGIAYKDYLEQKKEQLKQGV